MSTDPNAVPAPPPPGEPPLPPPQPEGEPSASESSFPTPGEQWDPTQQPPPDAAVGASGPGWQPPSEGGAPTPPPPSTSTDPAAVAQKANPEATISPSSFDVVADDGSTARITPGYSSVPCPNCGNTSLRTTNVQGALPALTLRGETARPGDQIVQCGSCGLVVATGDGERYEQDAAAGYYGPMVQAAVAERAATLELEDERQQIERERAELEARLHALDDRAERLTAEQERVRSEQGVPAEPAQAAAAEAQGVTTSTTGGGEGGNA